MGRILYIFPHPDDESFGPGPVLAKQRRQGHEVCLLTLTRGEATSQRHRFGYSKEEMARIRRAEMEAVARVLDLTDLTVLDFPDGRLAELNPLVLERAVLSHIRSVQPDVLVTYVVHGISGHPDHLVTHAVVKHAFCMLAETGDAAPSRLAFLTLSEKSKTSGRPEHLKGSPRDEIDCVVAFSPEDRARGEAALDCYKTYQEVIEAHQPLDHVAEGVCFILFGEHHEPPLGDLFEQLPTVLTSR